MLKAYAIGFFGTVAVILVVAGIVFVTQPKDEPGLLWGGEVYTSKEAFKGLSEGEGAELQGLARPESRRGAVGAEAGGPRSLGGGYDCPECGSASS